MSCLVATVRKPLLNELNQLLYFSLIADKTTDVAVVKEVIVYARFIFRKKEVQTSLLGLVPVSDGRAAAVLGGITKVCEKRNVNLRKLAAFGSDGAAVMISRRNWVSGLLKIDNPWLILNHCVPCLLALATAQAADEVRYVQKFKAVRCQLYKFIS